MIVLVICHHAAVTYGQAGSWYVHFATPSLVTRAILATFTAFNQAYFMGFLFLIAGYFAAGACDSKGPARFIRDRAIRLGIPSALFMLVIQPFTVYWLLRVFYDPDRPTLTHAYGGYIIGGGVLSGSGPMWFAVALLIFCCVYALVRVVSTATTKVTALPTHREVIGLILLMGTCSFLVRIVQPIGTNILNMQLCFFSQYIVLFTIGILAYRGNWLREIKYSFGIVWLKLALIFGPIGWAVIIFTSGALKDPRPLLGGLHWQSAAFSFWEALVCMGMCLGLTVLFRDRFNAQGPFARWMSQNSFSAYVFHPPILIAITLALRAISAPGLVLFVLASILAVPATFLIAAGLRQWVPRLSRIL